MRFTFLGTGSGAPSRTRNVSAIALQFSRTGALWLFDCGEGTQHQILRSPIRLGRLERLFVTHLDGDHLFGIPGLLASRSLGADARTAVTLYGPEGLEEFVRTALRVSGTRLGYPVEFVRTREGIVAADDEVQVRATTVRHRGECWAYAVEEREQIGRFDPERARALGVPEGPLWGRLKAGETIRLDDGREIDGTTLVGPARPGRKLVLSGDTAYTPRLVALARGADVLIHEATFLSEEQHLADRAAHSTAASAARVAREAEVRTLILTHFSPRYEAADGSRLPDLLAEARAVFPATSLAHDFLAVEVARHR